MHTNGINVIQRNSSILRNGAIISQYRVAAAGGRLWLAARHASHIASTQEKIMRKHVKFLHGNLGNYRYFSTRHSNRLIKYPILAACDIRYSQVMNFHISPCRLEDAKSLADKTVQILSESKKKKKKKEAKDNADKASRLPPEESTIEVKQAVDATKLDSSGTNTETVQLTEKQASLLVRGWRRTVKEVKHYYHGFKLLFIDVKICTRYIWGVLNGKSLTRRERKQLVRTTADLFRLVPFMVFILVPFMEFLLPVALKLFPGLLPSTFAESNKEKEKMKKRLKAKLEIAKFLQDTVEESALVKSGSGKHTELAREFHQFLKQIRDDGVTAQTEDISKFAQLFTDDITLDNMKREHLLALCKLLELNTIGTNRMIVFQLKIKLRQLKADDTLIAKEGIGALNQAELQQACRARGMRAIGVPEWRLRYQLSQWLHMHFDDKIPISLLLMSRALYLPDALSDEEKLKTIISALPDDMTTKAEIHAAEVTGDTIDPAAKIKLIKAEEEAIAKEKEEEVRAKEEEEEEALKEKLCKSKPAEILSAEIDLEKHTIEDKAEPIEATSKADVVLKEKEMDLLVSCPTREMLTKSASKQGAKDATSSKPVVELSSEEIEVLEDVLEQIAEEKKMNIELDSLKEDVDEYQEDLTHLKSLVELDAQIIESKGAKRLSSAVNRMIDQLTDVTDNLYRQKQHLLENIEVKQVRMKRSEELQHDEEALQNLQAAIDMEKEHVISLNELVLSMKRLQKIPDDTELQKIAEVLDEDKDGQINLTHALQVLREIGIENVNIEGSQMTDIIKLLKREEEIEKEAEEKKRAEENLAEETVKHQEESKLQKDD